MFKLVKYLKDYKKESIIGPVFKLIEACFELIVPIVMAKIIDVGIVHKDKVYVWKMGGVLVVLGVLGLACSLTAQYFAAKASLGFGTAVRKDLFKHINSLSYREIDKLGSHTLVTRMTADINTAQTGVNMLLRLLLRSPFIVIGSIIMALTISVKLTLIFLIIAPCLSLVIYAIMKSTVPRYKHIQKTVDRTNLITAETLSGGRVIRAFSRQEDEKKEFFETTQDLAEQQIIAGKISALMNPLTYVIVNLAIGAVMWFGGKTVYSGEITQGEVIALINYMNQILSALLAMTLLVTNITKMQASAIRINEVFEVKTSISDEGNVEIKDNGGDISVEFKGVSFTYQTAETMALKDITFSVKKGETIGIIGGTGSGKTSAANLIPRFYDAALGEVLVDGVNVKKYPLKQLRGKIGIVPQKAVLFKGTIRSNMQVRKKQATDEEIWKALEIAQAKEFVEQKRGMLDEPVLQEGKNFSGGQRQRLTIARALIGDPEILILDDSASALDLVTESRLRKALAEKTKGMTVFIISQRISSIKSADKIIVLEEGRMVGVGSHKELYKNCEVYREICLSQISQKEAEDIE